MSEASSGSSATGASSKKASAPSANEDVLRLEASIAGSKPSSA